MNNHLFFYLLLRAAQGSLRLGGFWMHVQLVWNPRKQLELHRGVFIDDEIGGYDG